MPFKTKEQRNIYQKNYYLKNPDKLAEKRRMNREYMKNKRLEDKLNAEAYKNDIPFEPMKRYD